jgi:TPR repeat/SPOR domain/WD40-like Beta Propeller Repeat
MQKIFIVILTFASTVSLFAQNELLEKGNKQCELNNFPAALKTYAKAASVTPNNADVLAKLASTYMKMGETEKAIPVFEKAVAIKGADALIALDFGKALMTQGKYEEAKQQFEVYAKKNVIEGKHFVESCDFAIETSKENSIYQVKNSSLLNTPFDEFGGAFIQNNFVYSSGRMDMQRKTSKMSVGSNQLFVSELKDGEPSSNGFYKSDLKNSYNDGPIAFSGNEQIVVLTHNNLINGIAPMQQNGIELSIALAEVNKNGDWVNPKPFNQNLSGYSSGFACLSADGNTLYFSSDRPGGQGGFDLYSSKKTGETWSVPSNLGDVINTAGNEISPFLDGKNLFFSSDYHHGMGGFDVFRAEMVGNDFKTIYHLGNQVNSSADDIYFVLKNGKGFVSSNRSGGKGGLDIYSVSKSAGEIMVLVKDAQSGEAIEGANLDFSSCNESSFLSDKEGKYSFLTTGVFDCTVAVSKIGYDPKKLKIKADRGVFEVNISREAPKFIGNLVDMAGNPLEGVTVKSKNIKTNEVVETYSNLRGEYGLALDKNSQYSITFSRPSFVNLQSIIKTGDGTNLEVLGKNILMNVSEALPQLPTDAGFASISRQMIAKGGKFAVQVASVSGDKVDMSAYDKIKSVGSIYTSLTNNTTKVKVGGFQTKEEAIKALGLVKAQGFIQSFIVEEGKAPVKPTEPTKPTTGRRNGDEIPTPPTIIEDPVNGIASDYKVRVVTLTDASKFDKSKLEAISTVETTKSGDKTVILLTNFKDLAAAKSAREKVNALGFKDAYTVQQKNGKLVKAE